MLENNKLSFFNIKLFSHLEENRKLEIIRYNKYLQNNVNISIINYIHLSNRYIIYESKGIGKEYIHDDDKFVNLKKLVRSKYILTKIFSFLDKKKKLLMLKYSKLYNKFFENMLIS